MRIVVFGLTISSSWGNGHATLWRGLCRALAARGHAVAFYERDVSYYAAARDPFEIPTGELVLYPSWEEVRQRAVHDIASADAAIVTSFCPDGIEASEAVLDAPHPLRCFYDLDTPVTLTNLDRGETPAYIGQRGLVDFDLVLSFTGGAALERLQTQLGARRVAPLYGHVDPAVHRQVPTVEEFRSDLSYLGTYAADRQPALERLFIEPARRLPARRFLIGGAQYPEAFPWSENIYFVRHLPPDVHPTFFCSSRLTLNVTRKPMAEMGWCPSGRLFEAAACGTPIISDSWEGLDRFFEPGEEIFVANSTADAMAAVTQNDADLQRIGRRGRERVLAEHTSARRAEELIELLGSRPGFERKRAHDVRPEVMI